MDRRTLLLAASQCSPPALCCIAQSDGEIRIGFNLSAVSPNAQTGVDAQRAFETRPRSSQQLRFRLAARKRRGSAGTGRRHAAHDLRRPSIGSAEGARRGRALITQEKVCAIIGTYQSAVAVTVSQICERYQIPFVSAENPRRICTGVA